MPGRPMATVAPNGRQQRVAAALCRLLYPGVAQLPAHRPATADMTHTEALLSACALCARTAPALLPCARERTASHVPTLYGIPRVPR